MEHHSGRDDLFAHEGIILVGGRGVGASDLRVHARSTCHLGARVFSAASGSEASSSKYTLGMSSVRKTWS